jgi:tRNA U34 2-thiouridine synthase MnmA/TrmU
MLFLKMGKIKAIALLSGGLDSLLSVILIRKQDIDVTALTFLTHFGCDITDRSSCSKEQTQYAQKYGFNIRLAHLGEKFLNIVKNPEYGHGKNMNPCMDCRILMLKEAGEFMKMTGADFVVTGEVLGQRPMSQRRDTFPVIDKRSNLQGLVLRPLSAKRLKPTIPEIKGLVDREKLYDFAGRSRKPQIALASEFGLNDYPAPAGGCLLTDPMYSKRLKELLEHNTLPAMEEISLLRLGRHFRVSNTTKIIVGRNEKENQQITQLARDTDYLVRVTHYGSPVTLVRGVDKDEFVYTACAVCARYTGAKELPSVEVAVFQGNFDEKSFCYTMDVEPAKDEYMDMMRI